MVLYIISSKFNRVMKKDKNRKKIKNYRNKNEKMSHLCSTEYFNYITTFQLYCGLFYQLYSIIMICTSNDFRRCLYNKRSRQEKNVATLGLLGVRNNNIRTSVRQYQKVNENLLITGAIIRYLLTIRRLEKRTIENFLFTTRSGVRAASSVNARRRKDFRIGKRAPHLGPVGPENRFRLNLM